MRSEIAKHVKLEHNPVAVVMSDEKLEKALQFKKGKFGCVMWMVQAAAKGRTAVLDADTTSCVTEAASIGFGKHYDRFPFDLDYYYHLISGDNKGREVDARAISLNSQSCTNV